MEIRRAAQDNKKVKKGAAFCQKPDGACDSVHMNSFDRCCKIASLVCCLVLGLEALMFGHDVCVQTRSLEGQLVTVRQSPTVLTGTMLASEKVTGN